MVLCLGFNWEGSTASSGTQPLALSPGHPRRPRTALPEEVHGLRLQHACNAQNEVEHTTLLCGPGSAPPPGTCPGPLPDTGQWAESPARDCALIRWQCALFSSEKIINKSGTQKNVPVMTDYAAWPRPSLQFIEQKKQASQAVKLSSGGRARKRAEATVASCLCSALSLTSWRVLVSQS